jgi:hypothetical protein
VAVLASHTAHRAVLAGQSRDTAFTLCDKASTFMDKAGR